MGCHRIKGPMHPSSSPGGNFRECCCWTITKLTVWKLNIFHCSWTSPEHQQTQRTCFLIMLDTMGCHRIKGPMHPSSSPGGNFQECCCWTITETDSLKAKYFPLLMNVPIAPTCTTDMFLQFTSSERIVGFGDIRAQCYLIRSPYVQEIPLVGKHIMTLHHDTVQK